MNNMYDILATMKLLESRDSKPDFLDLDKDGDRREPMKQAAGQTKQDDMDESALQAHIGQKKYGAQGMKALQQAGRDGANKEKMARIRARHDKMSEADVDEGNDFVKARLDAIKAGKPTFRMNGKVYRVTGNTADEQRMDEGFVDFMDKKAKYRTIGAEVDGRADDYTVIFRDGTRKRYQEMDGRRRVTTLEPVDAAEPQDDEGNVIQRGRGRPKGSKRAIGAKGPSGRSKLLTRKESVKENYDEEGPEDLMAAVDEELNAPGKHIDNLVDVLNATFDTMYSPEFERPRAMIQRYIELVTNTDVDHYDDEEDPNHEDEPMIRRMQHGNIARHIGEYDLGDYLAAAYHELHKLAGSNKTAGDIKEDYDKDEYDEEGEMAKSQARTIEDAARELQEILADDENLPEWVQKKITLALDYIDTARDYMKANPDEEDMDVDVEMDDEEIVAEKAVSKAQRAAAGIARAAQKGEIPRSELQPASKAMADMPAKELRKFAKTKEKGLPEKVKEEDKEDKEEVDETTVSGSVATSDAAPKAKKGGMQFGKGVYESQIAESFDRQLNQLTEGMNINMSMDENGRKSLTVNATDEDAEQLADILKMAGLGGHAASPACGVCGGQDMHEDGCDQQDMMEQELANSPDPSYAALGDTKDYGVAGGVNGPKLQSNPNNPGDNPLAMRNLGSRGASGQLNLGAVVEDIKQQTHTRLMDLYKSIS